MSKVILGTEAEVAGNNECSECKKKFMEKRNLLKHMSKFHGREKSGFLCVLCSTKITSMNTYIEHLHDAHNKRVEVENLSFGTISGKI